VAVLAQQGEASVGITWPEKGGLGRQQGGEGSEQFGIRRRDHGAYSVRLECQLQPGP
jgi:hypothetical protein